ncbi:hypothetical protein [Vreelandella populi]|uniref:Uncharacterized protein n=1 Tax=Vreelandella populi TaxID=2498858 RepID=A0A433LAJ3_9GAMM|nr:hypothetical protein [Halomonas populi]RUR36631.1 hypothetical protein ELY25_13365 [Halomonas populi]RUR45092.1 hypothetical protein ELY37_13595 [Halomonas populi]RUR51479.1 hypothetical protein ELY40_16925 [Halomonas populi]
MKYHKAPKQLDEREKLRKFRELDDAFAQALRQLEDPNSDFDIPTGPPVRSLAALEEEDATERLQVRERLFETRLKELMREYGQSGQAVCELIATLLSYDLWPEDKPPSISAP